MTTCSTSCANAEQLSLELFPPLTFEELLTRDNIRNVTVIHNRRLKSGWNVRLTPLSGNRTLTLPSYLLDAPVPVKEALIEWALLPVRPRRTSPARERRKVLERLILGHCADTGAVSRSRRPMDPVRWNGPCPGMHYDLREIFDKLNTRFFDTELQSSLRWGAFGSTTSYQAVRTAIGGSPFNLITIAGVYNHPDVPRFAIEAVMYHEMCHIAVPPSTRNGRRNVHSREFRKREREYPAFTSWHEWERNGLQQIMRAMSRDKHKRRRP